MLCVYRQKTSSRRDNGKKRRQDNEIFRGHPLRLKGDSLEDLGIINKAVASVRVRAILLPCSRRKRRRVLAIE